MNPKREDLQQQESIVQQLRRRVYLRSDPSADEDLLDQLADAEKKLVELLPQKLAGAIVPAEPAPKKTPRFLGPQTTGIQVETIIHIQPLPTGIYHLLDPATSPLLTVKVDNLVGTTRRIRVTAYLEGLSAHAVKTLELKGNSPENFEMHPTLLPKAAKRVTEVQWATLHIIVDILDNTLREMTTDKQRYAELCECHNTFPVLCLSRNSSFNLVRNPQTGEAIDLSRYYGAWVTPYAPAVQRCIRRAASSLKNHALWGYQGDPTSILPQVQALYEALKAEDLVYVNSVIDYGAAAGQVTQRTRLPRESLEFKSANCIDGTVLMASLLEGVSLNPAIILLPGHAFLGWEKWPGTNEFDYLETTLIGSADFDAACKSASKLHSKYALFDGVKRLDIASLRRAGIYPME